MADQQTVRTWELASGGLRRDTSLQHSDTTRLDRESKDAFGPKLVELSTDGSLVATSGANGMVHIWDAATGKLLRTLAMPAHHGVNRLVFSPDGRRLATCGSDSTVLVWDVRR